MTPDEPCVCGTDFTCMANHAVTIWCADCEGTADVVSEGVEENHYGNEFWVRWLDCGHMDVTRR